MALGNVLREFGVKVSLLFDKKKAEEAKKHIEELSRTLKETGLHVAEAAAALVELANISSEHSRALQESSEQLGINVEKLQELEYAAKVAAGVSREELGGALEGISKTLFEARNGSVEAAQTFIRLGVSIDDIRNPAITADKILTTLSDRFAQLPNGIYKTALANAAGGASFAKLLPLLNRGSAGMAALGKEAHGLGVIMSKSMIEKGAEFDRQLSRIWIVIKNVSYVLGNELMKYLWPVVNTFLKWISVNRLFLAQGLAGAVKGLGAYLKIVFQVLKFVVDRFKALSDALGGVERVAAAIGIAFGVFTSFKLIAGIGAAVKAFQGLAAVLGLVDIQSALIGAGFLSLILIIQDMFSDDSLIKEWIGVFQREFPNISKLVTGVFSTIKYAINETIAGFEYWYDLISQCISGIENLGDALAEKLQFHPIDETIKGFKYYASLAGQGAGAAGDYLENKFGTAKPSVAYGAGNSQSNTANNNMTANITVMVPPNMGPKEATGVVSQGVQDGFDSMMRQGRNQAIGGRAY